MKVEKTRRWVVLTVLLTVGIFVWEAKASFGQSRDLFNKLVATAKAEMEKKGGKLFLSNEWRKREAIPVLKAFQKEFPFVKEVDHTRSSGTGTWARWLIQIQQGTYPEYDIFHVASEYWPEYGKAGVFIKPPFDYKKLAESLPPDWGEIDKRAIDPEGMFIATTGLARGNAWNPALVPKGKEPTTWAACLDPMWKGNFLYDPRPKLTGLWWDRKTREGHINWLKGIMENKAVLNRGQTENLQKVIAGEFPIACGANFHSAFRLKDNGAPLEFTFPDPFPMDIGTQIHVVKWTKIPATTQLFILWLASKGQPALSKGYRGFPWHRKARKYELAKGKYVAICDAECLRNEQEYNKLHADILKLPGIR